jgi:KUP system potassium uptake protein
LLADLQADPPHRVPGTAVYMVSTPDTTPSALLHNLAHNKVLHEHVIFLSVLTEAVPRVPQNERIDVAENAEGFHSVKIRYGFMQDPDIPLVLQQLKPYGVEIPLEATTYFLGRETILSTERLGMARWRERLFAVMLRNALRATAFFRIPSEQVFEVGVHVEI